MWQHMAGMFGMMANGLCACIDMVFETGYSLPIDVLADRLSSPGIPPELRERRTAITDFVLDTLGNPYVIELALAARVMGKSEEEFYDWAISSQRRPAPRRAPNLRNVVPAYATPSSMYLAELPESWQPFGWGADADLDIEIALRYHLHSPQPYLFI